MDLALFSTSKDILFRGNVTILNYSFKAEVALLLSVLFGHGTAAHLSEVVLHLHSLFLLLESLNLLLLIIM